MPDQKDSLNKETVYVDIDDEITAIIEKVRSSQQKIVALVLPKRASVLQSIVNMKLLKRTADNAKKSLVLITTEAGLLPLAGTVGLYVARNLQTKPEIPFINAADADIDDIDEADDGVEFDPSAAANRSVGDLAVSSSVPLVGESMNNDAIETLQMDDDDSAVGATAAAAAMAGTKSPKIKKPKKDKTLAVPSFDNFRKKLLIGVPILLLLIIGLYVSATVLPKAEIVITTDTTNVNSNLAVNIDTAAKAADINKKTIPAQLQKVDKAGSQQVATTGKKNNGAKASGNVTITNCSGDNVSLAAGRGFTSGGLTFVSSEAVTIPDSNYTKNSECKSDGRATVDVTAQQGGANYNINSGTYSVANNPGGLTASGSQMAGGSDVIVQVVAQSDIDSATQKITAQNSDSVKQQLQDQLKTAGSFPIVATFVAGTPNTTASSKAGDEASTVSVSQTTTYTMFGVKQTDLKALVDADIKDKIDPKKQSILSEGLDKATFKVTSANTTSAQIGITTVAIAGPDLNAEKLKTQLAGMKRGGITDSLTNDPGVSKVDVKFSPFWVTSVPSKADKVTITFQKAN